jgi:hypothetical protein
LETPPLWVWAIIVGIIIAGKLAYRWVITKELARKTKQAGGLLKTTKWDRSFKNNKYDPRNYSPSRFKDYLAIKKGRIKRSGHEL